LVACTVKTFSPRIEVEPVITPVVEFRVNPTGIPIAEKEVGLELAVI